MAIVKEERIGGQRLILGDCLEVMPLLGTFDALVTDPPYGVAGGSGTLGKASKKTKYSAAFPDTRQYIEETCAPAVEAAMQKASVGAITTGSNNLFLYPEPDDLGIIFQPAATGLSKWGRVTSQPVLFYGKDPRVGLTIQPKHLTQTKAAEACGHPCPKPIEVMNWLVTRATLETQTILDPFMGSGTTLVACQKLGRQGTGIELDSDYFEIACKRVEEATRQPDLFVQSDPKPTQESLL